MRTEGGLRRKVRKALADTLALFEAGRWTSGTMQSNYFEAPSFCLVGGLRKNTTGRATGPAPSCEDEVTRAALRELSYEILHRDYYGDQPSPPIRSAGSYRNNCIRYNDSSSRGSVIELIKTTLARMDKEEGITT